MTAAPHEIPLSLAYHTVPELSPPDMVSAAAATGFRFIGARLLHGLPGRDPAPLLEDRALRRETLARLRNTGVGVLDASGARLTPATDMTAFAPFLEAAAELGARHVLMTGDDPDEGRLIARVASLCEAAARFGLTVDIEFVPWMTISNLTIAVRVACAVGSENCGIAVDALHFSRSRSATEDLAKLPPRWFRYLQLCDAPGTWSSQHEALLHEAVRERLFPGEGGIDLVGLLRQMPRGIPIALEVPTAKLALTMPADQRLKRAVTATRRVLALAYG
jgi:sugar phosphate isomerase/epimerase